MDARRDLRLAGLLGLAVLCAAAAVAGPAAARPSQTSGHCPDFTGPAWTYKNASAPSAPVYAGKRYTYTTLRLSCADALKLIRKVIPKTAHPPGPAALKYLPGYACVPSSTYLYGKKMFGGQCFSANAGGNGPGNGGSFSWSPDTLDPSSKRVK
jgi:hypothetical protein